MRQYEIDPLAGIRIRPRKPAYISNDNALKNLVQLYDQIDDPSNEETINHLRAIQYRLARNDFENWDDIVA